MQRPWDGGARPSGGWKEDRVAQRSEVGRKGHREGQCRAKELGLGLGPGEYGQLLSRLGCGQACLSDKTFLAAARIRVQGSVGSGQLVGSERGGD